MSEPTACERLVGRLLKHGEREGVCSRLGTGMLLLRRAYEGSLSAEAARALPVDGIKQRFIAHGQEGQFYRHLHFHIGCRFLGWPGMLASRFMHQRDVRQAKAGRREAVAEARGNLAALACADVLLARSQRRISRQHARERLLKILAEKPVVLIGPT
jgi:hypothetical protein